MKTLLAQEEGYPTHEFIIIDYIPFNAVVWNIGKHMPEGYIPYVYIDKDYHIIEGQPMYAVKMNNAQKILNARYWHKETMEDAAKKQFKLDNDIVFNIK